MKLLNDILPSDLFRRDIAPVNLQREVSLCQLCPAVDCHSRKLGIIEKNSRYPYMFVFDDFRDQALGEELALVLSWLQLSDSYIYSTSAMKCEGGERAQCEQYLLREIYLLNPQKIFLFTETYSLISNQVMFGVSQSFHQTAYMEIPHPRLWQQESDYHQAYHMILQHLQQGGQ